MSELKFKEAELEIVNDGADYAIRLTFADDDGKSYRHAVRIPVGEPMKKTLSGLTGYLQWFEYGDFAEKNKK